MKSLHADFLDPSKPICWCIKVVSPTGTVLAKATSWDEKITFDGVTYNPRHGGQMETLDSSAGTQVPQSTWYGIIDPDDITIDQLRFMWKGAVQTIFRIVPVVNVSGNYIGDPTPGADVLFFGDLAAINMLDAVHFSAEFRDLMQRATGEVAYCISIGRCQYGFGVKRGNMGCPATVPTYAKTIISHSGLDVVFAGTPPRLLNGRIIFTSGPNVGFEPIRIDAVATGGGNTTITLACLPPFAISTDTITVYGGCVKDGDACKANIPAAGGKDAGYALGSHPTTPKQDKINVKATKPKFHF